MGLKVVLAYSGGLDTSVIVPWLRENYDAEVVCVAVDVGQPGGLDGLAEKARATGASAFYGEDLREAFVEDFVWPTLRSGAVYGRKYLLGTSMARPIIARRMVEIAREVGADALAHGCTGKGNDQVRFELTFMALAPDLKVGSPLTRGLPRVCPCPAYFSDRGRREQAVLPRRESLAHIP
jgi:argininosuccinate synthase